MTQMNAAAQRESFLRECPALLSTYCADSVGSSEIEEACSHLVQLFRSAKAYTAGPTLNFPPRRIFYLELSLLEEEVVNHITGKVGNAPERYLSLSHVAIHYLVLDELKPGMLVSVRLRGVPIAKIAGQLRAHDVSSVISVRGTIVRLMSVQPLASRIAFSCTKCADIQVVDTNDGACTMPAQCPRAKCRGARRFNAPFQAEPLHPETVTINYQRLKLQIESQSQGRVPTSVEVELRGALCDTASAGDIVTCTGILKQDIGNAKRRGGGPPDRSGLTSSYLECNNLESCGKDTNKDTNVISDKNLAGINMIASRRDAFALFVHSLCPSILGHDLVKAGMILALFGGTPRSPESGQRGDTHLLVVGDPGAGKSQMLRAVNNVAPRGVLVSGNSATASGLTVTLVRDMTTGDTALEAGALVLGDLGVTCIDEFDKMEKTEHQALLEAMEQQRISIAKAGAVGSLPARTSVVAAANPTSGHYDDLKSVAENLKMNPALLSRFDLLFILKDSIAGRQQEGLTRHVISLHSGGKEPMAMNADDLLTLHNDGVETRLRGARYRREELIPADLIGKYITYAKRHIRPRLTQEASDAILTYYVQLRKASDAKDAMLITTRQLESLIRLAQARAKVELRTQVTRQDANDVIDLMKRSLYQMCTDVETGQIDSNRGPGGSMRSKDGRALVHWMQEEIRQHQFDPEHVFSHTDLVAQLRRWGYTEAKADKTIEMLNNMGDILTKVGGFKLRVSSVLQSTPAKR